ncbi:glyoxalase superfamily protein [Roseiterribacter gracilis]|uniref:VOC domain-containing protein n=1 Tax=Roseiterribacter gracilis TaxID=2812848 RepID=A0A8S8XAV2_9PROT|nr:hypothetical protein TMPK1_05230 [Rhodospirillales bacterium TMPK1]
MPTIDTYRKQAKLLQRWHRERNFSVGGKIRLLARYADLTDVQALVLPLPLSLAQEIVAVEAGFESWADLKRAADDMPAEMTQTEPRLTRVTPILFVTDVTAAAHYYESKLGFEIAFLHGKPPFYGAVARDGASLHLRFVARPNFAELAAREGSLILATIETNNVKALFAEYEARGVEFPQRLVRQAWGGLDFHIRDPDGNRISFVEMRSASG